MKGQVRQLRWEGRLCMALYDCVWLCTAMYSNICEAALIFLFWAPMYSTNYRHFEVRFSQILEYSMHRITLMKQRKEGKQ